MSELLNTPLRISEHFQALLYHTPQQRLASSHLMGALVGEEEGGYFRSFAYNSSGCLAMPLSCWVNHCCGCLENDSEQFYENFIVSNITPMAWQEGEEEKVKAVLTVT